MTNWYNTRKEDKIKIYNEIAVDTGLPDFAVEKDWWVVKTLDIIFQMEIGPHLVCKGGTSLSKAWGLIDRFSEDVDLAVDRNFWGFKGELKKKQMIYGDSPGFDEMLEVIKVYISRINSLDWHVFH